MKFIIGVIVGAAVTFATIMLMQSKMANAHETCYQWELRTPPLYDGDTLYIYMPELPPELSRMSVRVDGIDTPEIRGKCAKEKQLAQEAKSYVLERLMEADEIRFCNVHWGKYAGRFLADVQLDHLDLGALLVMNGYARIYDGGKRKSWCEQ